MDSEDSEHILVAKTPEALALQEELKAATAAVDEARDEEEKTIMVAGTGMLGGMVSIAGELIGGGAEYALHMSQHVQHLTFDIAGMGLIASGGLFTAACCFMPMPLFAARKKEQALKEKFAQACDKVTKRRPDIDAIAAIDAAFKDGSYLTVGDQLPLPVGHDGKEMLVRITGVERGSFLDDQEQHLSSTTVRARLYEAKRREDGTLACGNPVYSPRLERVYHEELRR